MICNDFGMWFDGAFSFYLALTKFLSVWVIGLWGFTRGVYLHVAAFLQVQGHGE